VLPLWHNNRRGADHRLLCAAVRAILAMAASHIRSRLGTFTASQFANAAFTATGVLPHPYVTCHIVIGPKSCRHRGSFPKSV
jgi:hypothetical protein